MNEPNEHLARRALQTADHMRKRTSVVPAAMLHETALAMTSLVTQPLRVSGTWWLWALSEISSAISGAGSALATASRTPLCRFMRTNERRRHCTSMQ
jgi:hypothetical protein